MEGDESVSLSSYSSRRLGRGKMWGLLRRQLSRGEVKFQAAKAVFSYCNIWFRRYSQGGDTEDKMPWQAYRTQVPVEGKCMSLGGKPHCWKSVIASQPSWYLPWWGELQTELDLAWIGGQLDKGEEHHTECYFVQVGINLGSNVRKSVDTICWLWKFTK